MQQQQKLRERVDDLEMQGADSAASDSLLSDKKEVEAKCKKLEKELQVRGIDGLYCNTVGSVEMSLRSPKKSFCPSLK